MGLDLTVGPGELVLLAGPSGCGKSTAALGLAGLLGGAVSGTKDGEVVLEGSSEGGVGIVQQDPESHLVTLTVRDEVAFGPENLALPREEILERIDNALSTVGADHLVDRHTNELSGGEKQRVAIASVLAMRPDVLVLDEPSANLDPRGRQDVLDVTMSLARNEGKAVVVSEHRLDRLVDVAREVVVLVDGKVSWRGTAEGMLSRAEDLVGSGVRVPGRPDLLGLDRIDVEPGEPVLEVEGLVSGYGEARVLEGVDLVVRAGEVVGLVGPNGGGKTTLLRSILGLAEAWEGSVFLAGDDVTGRPTSAVARRVGLVFQSPDHQIFEGTVRAEMEFGPRNMGLMDDVLSSRIDSIATEYGLTDAMDVHPFRLSLGQKRRLNVASVQVSSPRLLMLDEPFIGQDLGSIQALNGRLQAARSEGTAVLVVSHDLEAMACICDRAVVLRSGRTMEVEDPAVLSDGIPWGGGA